MDWILEPIEVIGVVGNWMELVLRLQVPGEYLYPGDDSGLAKYSQGRPGLRALSTH